MRLGEYAGRLSTGIKTFNTEVHRGAQRSLGRLSVFIFGIPPGPPVYWNHHVGEKIAKDPWGSISCRQNLEPKGLGLGPTFVDTFLRLPMMDLFRLWLMVGCHRRVWKSFKGNAARRSG